MAGKGDRNDLRSKDPRADPAANASRMASDVERSFVSLYQDKAGVSKQDAETWMAGLKASHRYLADVWPKNT